MEQTIKEDKQKSGQAEKSKEQVPAAKEKAKKPLSERLKERLKEIREQDSNIYPLY